jgi:hypothetical protein
MSLITLVRMDRILTCSCTGEVGGSYGKGLEEDEGAFEEDWGGIRGRDFDGSNCILLYLERRVFCD